MSFNLRKRSRVSYYEPDEPNVDEYLYCEHCSDFVYDYCAIHGPLLVIPDNMVVKTNVPAYVPRAALTIPHVFLHIAPSIIPGAGLGVFSTLTLPRGVRFGPYCGQRTQHVDSMYCWQIYDSNNKRLHVVDAADSDHSNWMRYVNCARHWKEQNLLAYQYKGQLYYRTIKIIPRFTELMVFYGSEFANALRIDLSKYNTAKYYPEIISTSVLNENKGDAMQEEYFTAEQFHFIDENVHVNENNQNSTNVTADSNKVNIEIDDSSHKEEIKEDSKTTKTRPTCETCQKTFATSKSLKEHVLRHLNTWKYHCKYCLYKSNINYRFKLHVGKHTNTFKFSCEKCNYKTNYGRNFRRHCLRHENGGEVLKNNNYSRKAYFATPKTCKICDFKTCSRRSFSTHVSQHNGNIYKCDLCSYSNHSKYNLSRHIKKH